MQMLCSKTNSGPRRGWRGRDGRNGQVRTWVRRWRARVRVRSSFGGGGKCGVGVLPLSPEVQGGWLHLPVGACVHHACIVGCQRVRRSGGAAGWFECGVSPVASAGQPAKTLAGSDVSPRTSVSGASTWARLAQPWNAPLPYGGST